MQFVTGSWRCRRTNFGASPTKMTNTIARAKQQRLIIMAGADSVRLRLPTPTTVPAYRAIACK